MAEALGDIITGLFKISVAPLICLTIIGIPWGMKYFLVGLGSLGKGFAKLFSGAKPA